MARKKLDGVRIAILATDGFEQSELEKPREAFDAEGADTKVVSPVSKPRGWSMKDWGDTVTADVALKDARADDFDALLLPGGVHNPDALRMIPEAVAFVKAFFDAGKPVAAICHGPWTVLEAGAARGKRMTSWPSLKTDLGTPGPTGWTRRWWWTGTSSQAASRTISRPSTARRSNYSHGNLFPRKGRRGWTSPPAYCSTSTAPWSIVTTHTPAWVEALAEAGVAVEFLTVRRLVGQVE